MIAECVEGVGSSGYLEFMRGIKNVDEAIDKFTQSEFMVGPHKAFQIARILQKQHVYLYSSLPSQLVKSLMLDPIENEEMINDLVHKKPGVRVAILPYATSCIASLEKEKND